VAHELRTTYHPALQNDASLLALAEDLDELGARHWVLQRWRELEQTSPHPLTACWRWPDEDVLQGLRRHMPELTLR
jgi:pyruvate formate lyase activating enzyme